MNTPVPEHQTYVPTSAGAQLRAYRENAQLTVDDVAHHLKLARRQVLAIENDDLDALPGPTFVRGFIRNYARLLRIDPVPLLEAGGLATAPPAASMERIAPTMGELPADDARAGSWTRWLIPAGLVLVLAAGVAYYEFGGVAGGARKLRKESVDASAPVSPPAAGDTAAVPATPAVDSASPHQQTPAPLAPAVGTLPSSEASVAPTPHGPVSAAGAPASAPARDAATPVTTAKQEPAADALKPGTGRVDLSFTGPSWVEVRDAQGSLILSKTLGASEPQNLTGTLPLSVTIGNARAARLAFNGTPVDLAPYTQREIARLTLPPRK